MRLLAVADCHLGHTAFKGYAESGQNQHEADVAATFTRFIDRAIELRPDVITVAGDIFDRASPRNRTVVHAFQQFARLTRALPETVVAMCLGNHDYARADGSSALPLFAELPNVYVAWSTSMRFRFPDRDLAVLAVPDVPMLDRPALRTDPAFKYNVLVLHGEAMGVKQTKADARCSLTAITPDEMGTSSWDWIALGHYHQFEHVAPNAAYSGSIDFTSSNPWGEIATPKGFIERDLASGAETFHVLEPGRRFVDLDPIYGQGATPAELDRAIAAALDACNIDGAVVRLKVLDVSLDIERALNQKTLRSYKARALFLRLDIRRPAAVQAVSASGVPLGRRKFSPIEERVRAMLGSDAREVPADVDKGALIDKALYYLKEAERREEDSPAQAEPLVTQLTDSLQGAA